uniref:Uncharacterized protein n=1 Tax=Riboviria sp. TaxID=2585031 RepID=A0A514D2D8_9VIRU|nr:MAG: hypothetical protein H4BulkLitter233438_000001 [Riboviria sp.]
MILVCLGSLCIVPLLLFIHWYLRECRECPEDDLNRYWVLAIVPVVSSSVICFLFRSSSCEVKICSGFQLVGRVDSETRDQRPDLLAMSDLKHKDPRLYLSKFYDRYYRPFWGLPIIKWLKCDMRFDKETHVLVSAELLTQVLSQPVCRLNADDETCWLRINQSLTSLHTVNEDRNLVLSSKHFVRQETACAAHFIFKWENWRLRHVNFPRPH